MRRKKVKEQMSIGIAVSFDGSSTKDCKIVTLRCDSSTATVTSLGRLSKDGINFTLNPFWTEMLELNGRLATEVKMGTGDKTRKVPHESR
jgi:hypothetical protein